MNEIERPSQASARLVTVHDRESTELLDAAERAVSALSNWELSDRQEASLRAVRRTSLLRFKDDVTLNTEPGEAAGQTRLVLYSASRVGKGDLGQNPRNLRELVEAMNRELG